MGDVEACKLIMHEMRLRKLMVSKDSYNTLLKAYARSRDAGGAVRVLRNMQRKGRQNPRENAHDAEPLLPRSCRN